MNEVQRIADEIQRAIDGDPWHGPSTMRVLESIGSDVAAARPLPDARTIWEIVLHLTAWAREVHRRLEGPPLPAPMEGDWPPVGATDPAAWNTALADLRAAHEQLVAEVARFPESRLRELVGGPARDPAAGTGLRFDVMLHGVVQHAAYHTAQISTLRRIILAGASTS